MTDTRPDRFDEIMGNLGNWQKNCLQPEEVKNIGFLYRREGYNYYVAIFLGNTYIYRTKVVKVCDKCNGSGKL